MNSDSESVESIDYKSHEIVVEEYNETNRRLSDRRPGIINTQTSKRTVTPIPLNTYINNNLPHHNDVPLKRKSWFLYICCCKRNYD